MNVNAVLTKDYENKSNWTLGENKPNSNPISKKPKMNANLYVIEDYRKNDDFAVQKNKPNSNPICQRVKMSANVYVIEDYENETAFRSKKTNPNKPNFKWALFSAKIGNFFTKKLRKRGKGRGISLIWTSSST